MLSHTIPHIYSLPSALRTAVFSAMSLILAGTTMTGQEAKPLPKASANQNLAVAFSDNSVEWNPLRTYSSTEAQLYTALYEGLVAYDPGTLKPVPGVARAWSLSEDRKTYTFNLRPDSRFSDGTRVDAGIFMNTFLAVLNPSGSCPFAGLLDAVAGAKEYRSGKIAVDQVAIKAIDADTLEIQLSAPSAQFIQILCHQSLVPVHPDMLAKTEWHPDSLLGNGPYRVQKVTSEGLLLKKSETYWDKDSVMLESINLILKDDSEGITRRYNSGEIHWIESGMQFDLLESSRAIQVSPQFSTTLLYFNHLPGSALSAGVRQALAMLLPMDKIRSRELFNVPAARLVPEIPFYPSPEVPPAGSRKEALELLAKAGYPEGKGLRIRVLFPDYELFHTIGKLMQDAMSGLSLEFAIAYQDPSTYFASMDNADCEMATLSWVGDYADPMTFLDLYYGNSSLNQSSFHDQEFDELIEKATSMEGKDRYAILSRAESRLLTTAQVIPLSHSPSINVVDLDVLGGWYRNPLNIHPFKNLFLKSRKPPRNVAGL